MANIKADEITNILREEIEHYEQTLAFEEVGSVISVGDGIARVHGLEKLHGRRVDRVPARCLRHRHEPGRRPGRRGAARRLHRNQEGDVVKRTGSIMSVPVGEAMIGRVVDALGMPIDGKGPIQTTQRNPIERLAPGVVDRQPVNEPMQTGIKADRRHDPHRPRPARTDHRRPPDRQNRHRDRHHHQSEGRRHDLHLLRHRAEALHRGAGGEDARRRRRHGLHHRGFGLGVRSRAHAVPAPFAGCAIGEYFRDKERHALCVYDDLSKHARPIARFRCCCAVRRAAKRFRATCSSPQRACWSAPPS